MCIRDRYIGEVAAVRHKVRLYSDTQRETVFNEISGNYAKTKYTKDGAIKTLHTVSYTHLL